MKETMEHLKLALDRFRSSHSAFLETQDGTQYSTGYGLDPARKGATGIIVYAMSDDEDERATLFMRAKETLPTAWEGHPVYLKGMSMPWAPKSK